MDGKSFIFVVAFLAAVVLVILGIFSMVFDNLTITSSKVYLPDKILLAFALLHFVLQGQTCLLCQISLDFLLLHSIF